MGDKSDYKNNRERYNEFKSKEKSEDNIFEIQKTKKKEDENDKWFDTDEAATYLRLTPNALRILVHRARVKSYKLGSRLRFKKEDLVSILHPKED